MKEEPNLFDKVVEENEVYLDELPKKRQKRSHREAEFAQAVPLKNAQK